LREPLDAEELELRASRLQQRACLRASQPRVDDAGLVRVGSEWVDLPPVQLAVARLLIDRLGRVVPAAQIQAGCRSAGGSVHPKAVKAVIGRVKARLDELGLVLTNVRDRGYLLEPGGRVKDTRQQEGPSRQRPV
jgi:DNA-binding response OmpR family regulator